MECVCIVNLLTIAFGRSLEVRNNKACTVSSLKVMKIYRPNMTTGIRIQIVDIRLETL